MTTEQEVTVALTAWHGRSGFSNIERIRAALQAAEVERARQSVPPARRMLCAFCVRTSEEGDVIHEAMTIIKGNAVCHEHIDWCPESKSFTKTIESIVTNRNYARETRDRRW